MTDKPHEAIARCYATVLGVDFDTVEDWYIDGDELVLVTRKESPTRNRGWR